jgi:molecular chaperone HscB
MDPFATLGIDRTFDIDLAAVERTHRELSRALHPDKHSAGGASERRYALSKAIEVNEAWRTIRDPIRRAESLFSLAGIAVGESNEPKPSADLLMDVMEQRESLAEARSKQDLESVRALSSNVAARAREAERALSEGFRQAGPAVKDRALLEGLLPRLGELRFYRRFLDEVNEVLDQTLPAAGE